MLAPKSNTTFIPILFGQRPARAGFSTPSTIFKINLDNRNNAPVFPADNVICDLLFFCDSIDCHMLVLLLFLAAVKGLSSSLI